MGMMSEYFHDDKNWGAQQDELPRAPKSIGVLRDFGAEETQRWIELGSTWLPTNEPGGPVERERQLAMLRNHILGLAVQRMTREELRDYRRAQERAAVAEPVFENNAMAMAFARMGVAR